MSVQYSVFDQFETNERVYTIKIPIKDIALVNLNQFDSMLFNDIEKGDPSTTPVADRLLGLETLIRRIEEQL